jgi:hypothetical protein
VVILLDASERVIAEKRFWEMEIKAADGLVAQMPPATQIGLATFSDSIERTVHLSADRHRLLNILAELRTSPRSYVRGSRTTALWNVIRDSLGVFCALRAGDVLYVISDGTDNTNLTKPQELETVLVGAGIRVFAFRPEGEEVVTKESGSGWPQLLQALVESTGGSSVSQAWQESPQLNGAEEQLARLRRADSLPLRLAGQYHLMSNYYRVQIESPEPTDKTREWDLKIVSPAQFKDAVLLYPRLPARCSTNSLTTTNPK